MNNYSLITKNYPPAYGFIGIAIIDTSKLGSKKTGFSRFSGGNVRIIPDEAIAFAKATGGPETMGAAGFGDIMDIREVKR